MVDAQEYYDLEKINVEWCAQNNYYNLEKINVEWSGTHLKIMNKRLVLLNPVSILILFNCLFRNL